MQLQPPSLWNYRIFCSNNRKSRSSLSRWNISHLLESFLAKVTGRTVEVMTLVGVLTDEDLKSNFFVRSLISKLKLFRISSKFGSTGDELSSAGGPPIKWPAVSSLRNTEYAPDGIIARRRLVGNSLASRTYFVCFPHHSMDYPPGILLSSIHHPEKVMSRTFAWATGGK